jgi:hypothetical protein
MTDMYYLDERYFWPMFGGKIVTVTWFDSDSSAGNAGYQLSSTCPVTSTVQQPFTLAPCIPMIPLRDAEFFDYDSRADEAVFRPATAEWSIQRTSGSRLTKQWGGSGDIPVPADYDSDGRKDLAVWRPSTGEWWILQSNSGTPRVVQWGTSGDVPVPADYDGDGKIDLAVWRPSTGVW